MKYWLWAIPKGFTDRLDEAVLTSFPLTKKQAEKVKIAASKDGWHSFRLVKDDNEIPNFAAGVKK